MEASIEFTVNDFSSWQALQVQTTVISDDQDVAFTLPMFHNLASLAGEVATALARQCQKLQPSRIDVEFDIPISLEAERYPTVQVSGKAITVAQTSGDRYKHIQQCMVLILTDDMTSHSAYSGFFIGPQQILTVSHTVQQETSSITIIWNNQRYLAKVLVDLPSLAATILYLDIAAEHPIVSLNLKVPLPDQLFSFGYSNAHLQSKATKVEELYDPENPGILRLEGQLEAGMDGGPLIDPRTGQVCGIVRDSRSGWRIQAILEEVSKYPYHLPKPIDEENTYTLQQFEQDVKIYTTYVEKSLGFRKLIGAIPHTVIESVYSTLEAIYIEPLIEVHKSTETIMHLLDRHQHVILLGVPGSGKSMLLHYLAWSHAHAHNELKQTSQLHHKPVPIFIELRRLIEDRRQSNYDFISFMEMLLKRVGIEVDRSMFDRLLERGSALLLFDGLDEVATLSERIQLVEEIEQFARRYPKNRVLVASRPIGYEQARFPEDIFVLAQILQFNEEHIRQYLTAWYHKSLNTAYLSQNAKKDLEELIKVINVDMRVYVLATNPLLLALIAEVYWHQRQIPASRTSLYKSIADLLLERWFITDIPWTRDNIRSCVVYLAMFFHRRSMEEITRPLHGSEAIHLITTEVLAQAITDFFEEIKLPEKDANRYASAYRFINLIRGTLGIIVEYGESVFGFVHHTFQEYFVAVYIYEQYGNQFNNLYDFLTRYLNDLQWHDILFFLLEMLELNTVNKLLDSLLSIYSSEKPTMSDKFFAYERGLDYLRRLDSVPPLVYSDISLLQMRLMNNINETRVYGESPTRRSELSTIIDRLNNLSLQITGKSFIEWCKWHPPVQQPTMSEEFHHTKLDIFLFVGSCLCKELMIENSLAEQVINQLGEQTFNAATTDQREQAVVMLSQIAKTRQYGEKGGKKLAELELQKRLAQRRELLQQQISTIKSRLTQIQMAYQQHLQQLDVLQHQSEQLKMELEQVLKQEASSSDLKILFELQDKLPTRINQGKQIMAMFVAELQQQQVQFVNTQYQIQSIEQEIESLSTEQVLRDTGNKDQQKLQQQRNETQQQISSVRKHLDRTQIEYSHHLNELVQLQSRIEQLYSEQAKLRQQGISSKKIEELLSFQNKLREQISQSKYIIDTLSQELQVQEKQLNYTKYQLESIEREIQTSQQTLETTQTKQVPLEQEQYKKEEHIVTTSVVEQIPVHRYYIALQGPRHNIQIGQTLTFTLHFLPTREENSESLLLPVNAQEIGIYLEAPGFYLEGEHLRSLLVVDGRPAKATLEIQCRPVLSGEQTLRILLYPGGSQTQEQSPTILTQAMTVVVPTILPPIPELIDQRVIPDPQPDIELIVVLEELHDTQQLQIYCTCPILHMERVTLGALFLSLVDIACLRQTAIQYASELCAFSLSDTRQGLQQLGAMIFDQLMPSDHELNTTYWKLRSLSFMRETPLSLLIVSDEQVQLPWELVCPYEQQPSSNEIVYDDFLADSFVLSHWVARQGLALQAEAPLGWLALDHYHQYPQFLPHWHAILSDDTFDEVDQPREGYRALQEPKLPYYGLHILRYHDPDQETRITTRTPRPEEVPSVHNDAEKMTYERRLDFTRKHPIIGLSLVEIEASPSFRRTSQRDTQLEAGWCIPFMRAGASAVVGTRWSVLPEVDQLFFRTFYTMIRGGTSLGWAVGAARAQVKQAFPMRPDWLAYTYFGHPWCTPYLVQPAQGFTLFEALEHPEEDPFTCGESYQFLASYRSEAPLWYNGHLQMQQTTLQNENVSIMVISLNDNNIQTYPLIPLQESNDYQQLITLTMPQEETTYPVMIRFQHGKKELQTFILHLDVVAQGGKSSDESSV